MKNLVILVVEDNAQDAMLLEEALSEQQIVKKFYHVDNGSKAISFLKKDFPYEQVDLPDLIFMDINMPIMDGHETLQQIKIMPDTQHIPVLMLTTSSRKEDVLKAYRSFASSYIVKPDDIYGFDKLVESFKTYWTKTVQLPFA